MDRRRLARLFLVVGVLVVGMVTARPQAVAQAASLTFRVDSTRDIPDAIPGDGLCGSVDDPTHECTLRAAIEEANAQASGSTISITVPAGRYQLSSGPLTFTANRITILGAGADTTSIIGVTAAGSSAQVVNVGGNAWAGLEGVTITGGRAQAGGGLYNSGTVLITASVLMSNTAPYRGPEGGAAIYNKGAMTLSNTTLSGNTTTVTAGSSTFSGDGGGIFNSGAMTLTNTTLSGNSAVHSLSGLGGGAIYNNGTMRLTYSTLSGNVADSGQGGALRNAGHLRILGTLVANSAGGNCSGTIADNGYNLDSDGSCGLSQPTDISKANPLLGPLQHNGGPTQTMALQAGSPAIDHGGTSANGCPATDQRGVSRPQGPACDIGAFERVP